MENLAFLHASTAYEDPSEVPTMRSLAELGLTPNPAMLGIAAAAGLAVLGSPADAEAAVSFGDRGPAVYDVQAVLSDLGYNTCGVDGVFGSCTDASVVAFQRDYGLVVDGVVGPATASALGLDEEVYGSDGEDSGGGGFPDTVTISTNGSPLTVRTGPGTFYAPIDYLSDGTSVRTVGSSGGWYEIAGGGWISADWTVEGGSGSGSGGEPPVDGSGTLVISTNGSELLARSGPGAGFAVVGGYANGAVVDFYSYYAGWYETSLGWVSASWVDEL